MFFFWLFKMHKVCYGTGAKMGPKNISPTDASSSYVIIHLAAYLLVENNIIYNMDFFYHFCALTCKFMKPAQLKFLKFGARLTHMERNFISV